MTAIFKREIRAYFTTPVGYVFVGMFLLLSGILFIVFNLIGASPSMDSMFFFLTLLFTVLIPILTMRLISEEKNAKTDQLLLTSPVKVSDIVLGKFFAATAVYFAVLVLTLLYVTVLAKHASVEYSKIFCQYIGMLLLGMTFISIGLFISSLTENQIVAVVVTFVALIAICLLELIRNTVGIPLISKFIGCITIRERFEEFNLGVLGIVPVIYYLSTTALFLFFAGMSIEQKRFN